MIWAAWPPWVLGVGADWSSGAAETRRRRRARRRRQEGRGGEQREEGDEKQRQTRSNGGGGASVHGDLWGSARSAGVATVPATDRFVKEAIIPWRSFRDRGAGLPTGGGLTRKDSLCVDDSVAADSHGTAAGAVTRRSASRSTPTVTCCRGCRARRRGNWMSG